MFISSLRAKIFSSFFLLILMLAVAGGISILQLQWLSNSVHGFIENNYKSIRATKTMIEALEREDSGVLLLLLGEQEEGSSVLTKADRTYREAFEIARNNQTEENEEEYIRRIDSLYQKYKDAWTKLKTTGESQNIAWYKNNIHKLFIQAKREVEKLMLLNQERLYEEASGIKEKSRRAIMPGVVSVIAAIIFSLMLNFYINKKFVAPIHSITAAIRDTTKDAPYLKMKGKVHGDFKELKNAVNELIRKLQD